MLMKESQAVNGGEPLVICTLINACYGERVICIVIMGEMAVLLAWGRVLVKACPELKNLCNVHTS